MTSDTNPSTLASYCCLYCGACDMYQQNIGRSGKEFKRLLDAYGFSRWASKEPGFESYELFYEILNNIITTYGECSGCKKGGGNPECKIRICSKDKGYQTCAECPTSPCEELQTKIASAFPNWTKDFQELKQTGTEKWSQKQQKKVEKGFAFSNVLEIK